MKQFLHDLLNLIFPLYCPVCGNIIYQAGEVVCLDCELGLPRTGYSKNPDNPVSRLFWGRSELECATSLFLFEKGSAYQTLLHQLKYKGARQIGVYLGTLLGHELKQTPYAECDLIVPVPLHPRKKRKRGYNQSEIIGESVASVLDMQMDTSILKRKKHTESQTRKGRYERSENMTGVFELANRDPLVEGLRLLLIDDVVTTGSTLEDCANQLLKVPGLKVMAATVACA